MAHTVFFHVGLPKTGTTYLQTLMWNNRDELHAQGVLLPGFGVRQHLWASLVVREDAKVERRAADAPEAWDLLVAEINEWPGTAVVSHEFFAGASQEQAERAIAALGDAEVHVVVTARDLLSLVTARWQEYVKNGETLGIDDYPADGSTDPADEWGWASMDVGDVLRRWGATLPPERVHVLTLPKPGEPRETLWQRFAGLLGVDPARCDTSDSEQNESLGVVEVELLRRVNGDLTGFGSALDRGVWIRGFLAQGKLVPRHGEKFWPSEPRIEQLRERGDRAVDLVKRSGFDVIGDVEDLRTPAVLPERRHPASVTEAEMLAAATETIAAMMHDVRELSKRKRPADVPPPPPPPEPEPSTVSKVAWRLRRMWRRS